MKKYLIFTLYIISSQLAFSQPHPCMTAKFISFSIQDSATLLKDFIQTNGYGSYLSGSNAHYSEKNPFYVFQKTPVSSCGSISDTMFNIDCENLKYPVLIIKEPEYDTMIVEFENDSLLSGYYGRIEFIKGIHIIKLKTFSNQINHSCDSITKIDSLTQINGFLHPKKGGEHTDYYDNKKRLKARGYFKDNKLINGKYYIYNCEGILSRILIFKNGKYLADGEIE